MAMPETLKALIEGLMAPSLPTLIFGILFIFLGPVFLHIYLTRTASFTTFPSILLLGPSGAGKTSLLAYLERRGAPPFTETRTSQTASAVELAVVEKGGSKYTDDLDASGAVAKKFFLVDTPGHGKLRGFAMAPLVAGATAASGGGGAIVATTAGSAPGAVAAAPTARDVKAIVFMLDSSSLSEPDALATAAAYLYDVLLSLQKRVGAGKTSKAPPSIPVLVAVNKLDLFTALPASKVKADLEVEIARIRSTRSRGLLDSGVGTDEIGAAGDEAEDWLGEYGSEKFSFAQMAEFEVEVDFIGGSVLGGGSGHGIDDWWSWITDKI